MTDRARARSRVEAAIGPVTESVGHPRKPGQLGHQPESRLDAIDTTEGRRDSDRATPIRADGQRHHPRRHRRRRSPARPAGGPGRVVRVAGDAVDLVESRSAIAELGVVGLAHDHGPRRDQPADTHAVHVRHEVGQRTRAVGRRPAGQPHVVLDRDRYAGQRSRADAAVDLLCRGQRDVVSHHREGVELVVARPDRLQCRPDRLRWPTAGPRAMACAVAHASIRAARAARRRSPARPSPPRPRPSPPRRRSSG